MIIVKISYDGIIAATAEGPMAIRFMSDVTVVTAAITVVIVIIVIVMTTSVMSNHVMFSQSSVIIVIAAGAAAVVVIFFLYCGRLLLSLTPFRSQYSRHYSLLISSTVTVVTMIQCINLRVYAMEYCMLRWME